MSDLFGAAVGVGEVAAHVRSDPAQHDLGGDNATVTAGAAGTTTTRERVRYWRSPIAVRRDRH
ncbi:hypothetical protein [Nocardia sp. NBC_00403]|uniref:hypothetical protein n=1 Tax=Nocardia sp. NBC_00403 TaxID=2975990 RepID=UPI002E1FBB13